MNYYGYSAGWGFWTVLWHILIIILIIWVLVRIFGGPRRWNRGRFMQNMWQAHSAIELLNERYAKGEITKEEYEERKKTLLN